MRVAFLGRWTRRIQLPLLQAWRSFLLEEAVEVWIHEPLAQAWEATEGKPLPWPRFTKGAELPSLLAALVVGGDGAFLDAARLMAPLGVPLLGIHAGRLGFLTPVPQENLIPATRQLLSGSFSIEKRPLLTLIADPPLFDPAEAFAVNEATFSKAVSSEMILIDVYLNGELINTYWADGLLVATPTGSTAYSLACGGPIVMPACSTFILTPMAPHALTVRPLVIPDDGVLTIACQARSDQVLLALDGRYTLMSAGAAVALRKSHFALQIIQLPAYSYFHTLRDRLAWGLDRRES